MIRIGQAYSNLISNSASAIFGSGAGDKVKQFYASTGFDQISIGKSKTSSSGSSSPSSSSSNIIPLIPDGKKPKMTDIPLTDSNRASFDTNTVSNYSSGTSGADAQYAAMQGSLTWYPRNIQELFDDNITIADVVIILTASWGLYKGYRYVTKK